MKSITLIEDNASDREIVRIALQEAGLTQTIVSFSDGASGIDYALNSDNCAGTSLFIVDVNLPRHSGHEVLRAIRSGPCKEIPVIMMTSSDRPEDKLVEDSYYFKKPIDLLEFLSLGKMASRIISAHGT